MSGKNDDWDFSELKCPRCGKMMTCLTCWLEGESILIDSHGVTTLECMPERNGCGLSLDLGPEVRKRLSESARSISDWNDVASDVLREMHQQRNDEPVGRDY